MKTIITVFVWGGQRVSVNDIRNMKKYPFRTNADVGVGAIIKVEQYSNPIQVVEILPTPFKFADTETGELSNELKDQPQWQVRELIL